MDPSQVTCSNGVLVPHTPSQAPATAAALVAKCWITYGGTMEDTPNHRELDPVRVETAIEEAIAAERERCIALVKLHVSDREDEHSLIQAMECADVE
jgi:hypothetical protein